MEVEGSVIHEVMMAPRVEKEPEVKSLSEASSGHMGESGDVKAVANVDLNRPSTISERLNSILVDGLLNSDNLDAFVLILNEEVKDLKDMYLLMEPLLVCDITTMKSLVTSHGLLQILENWIEQCQASDTKILRVLLKLAEKALRRIHEAPHHMTPKLIEQLKTLRDHLESEIGKMASNMVTSLRFSIGDNYDHTLDPLREHLHGSHKRKLEETPSELNLEDMPNPKRSMTSDSISESGEFINLNMAQERMLKAAEEEQISAKTGKPKKRVTWRSDEILTTESLFYKNMPVQYEGTLEDFEAAERRPRVPDWVLPPIAWGTQIPTFIITNRRIMNEPTRCTMQENDRQKSTTIALYLSDTDIPPNPQEPSLQIAMQSLREKFTAPPMITIPATKEAARRVLPGAAPAALQRVQLNPHQAPATSTPASSHYTQLGGPSNQPSAPPVESLSHPRPPLHSGPQPSYSYFPNSNHQGHHPNSPPSSAFSAGGYMPHHNPDPGPPVAGYAPNAIPIVNDHPSHWQSTGGANGYSGGYNGFQGPNSAYAPTAPSGGPYHHHPPPTQTSQIPGYAPRPVGAPGYAPHPLFQPGHSMQLQPGYAQHPMHNSHPHSSNGSPHTNYGPPPSAPHRSPEKKSKKSKKRGGSGKPDPSSIVHHSEVYPTSFIFSRLSSKSDRARFVCNQWRKSATCEYGESCKFLHPKDNSNF